MALTTQSANLVRQKTYMTNRNPGIFYALKALFLHLAANKGNPDLAIINIDGATADDASGQILVNAACTLYAVYGKKTATDTDSYLVLFDDAADDTGAATDARIVLPFLISGDEHIFIASNGIPMAAGLVAKTYTDFDGVTDSTAGDSPNGFVIVGA